MLLNLYRSIKTSNKLLIFGAIVLLTAAVTWQQNNNPILVTSVTIGILLGAHTLFTYPRHLLTVVIIAVQVVLVSFISLIMGQVLSQYNQDGDFATLTGVYISLFVVALSFLVAYYWAKGRVWFNLAVSFAIFDVAIVLVGSFLNFKFVYILTIAAILSVGYLGLRTLRKKKLSAAPSSKKRSVGDINQKALKAQGFKLTPVDGDRQLLAATHPTRKPFIILPLKGKVLAVEKNQLLLDDEDITPALEFATEQARKLAKQLKVSKNLFHVVVPVSGAKMGADLMSVDSFTRSKPDRKIGSVFVSDMKGFNRLLSITRVNDKKVSTRTAAKLSKLSEETKGTDATKAQDKG